MKMKHFSSLFSVVLLLSARPAAAQEVNDDLRSQTVKVNEKTKFLQDVTFEDEVKFEDKASFKHFVGFHGNTHFHKNVEIDGTLSVADLAVANCINTLCINNLSVVDLIVSGSVTGVTGATGATGPIGATGLNGLNGNNGINGTNGIDGINGINGINGIDGINGINGINGLNGVTGATGATGATGPAGSLLGNLFINPYMMLGQSLLSATTTVPDDSFNFIYGNTPNTPIITAWTMPFQIDESSKQISTQFVLPDDMDTTRPVFADFYLLIPDHAIGGENDFSKLIVKTQYVTPAVSAVITNEFGVTAPATGFSETITTPDFPIYPPLPAVFSFNMTINVVTVQLNNNLMANAKWAYMVVARTSPALGTDYIYDYALSCIGIRYTRLP